VFTGAARSVILPAVTTTGTPSIGSNIKRLRLAKGYRIQGDFAKALDVPQPRLADWENDRYKTPDLFSLLKMAKVLGCSIDVILEGIDKKYDLVRQKNDLVCHPDQVHSALSQGEVTKSDAENTDATRRLEHVLKELNDAALIFQELSELSSAWSGKAAEWTQRLIALQIDPIYALAGRQAPMGRSPSSGIPARRRSHTGPSDRRRRKRPA
jgi:transcriptional regulator with XRE-family HTH domain